MNQDKATKIANTIISIVLLAARVRSTKLMKIFMSENEKIAHEKFKKYCPNKDWIMLYNSELLRLIGQYAVVGREFDTNKIAAITIPVGLLQDLPFCKCHGIVIVSPAALELSKNRNPKLDVDNYFDQTLKHECRHISQFEYLNSEIGQLGINYFLREFSKENYFSNPLERDAYRYQLFNIDVDMDIVFGDYIDDWYT